MLYLLSAVLPRKLPARERATECSKVAWWYLFVICVLHGVLTGFVAGYQVVNPNITYQSMRF